MKTLCLLFLSLATINLAEGQTGLKPDSTDGSNIHAEMDQSTVSRIKIPEFNAVKISANINAVLIPIPDPDTNYLYLENAGEIKFRIENNTLSIRAKNALLKGKVITVLVGVKNINRLILDGNSIMNTNGILPGSALEISCSDNSTCMVNSIAEIIKTTQTTHSKIIIAGLYTVHQTSVNGYGDIIIEYSKQ